jgi:hypothetical protein
LLSVFQLFFFMFPRFLLKNIHSYEVLVNNSVLKFSKYVSKHIIWNQEKNHCQERLDLNAKLTKISRKSYNLIKINMSFCNFPWVMLIFKVFSNANCVQLLFFLISTINITYLSCMHNYVNIIATISSKFYLSGEIKIVKIYLNVNKTGKNWQTIHFCQ